MLALFTCVALSKQLLLLLLSSSSSLLYFHVSFMCLSVLENRKHISHVLGWLGKVEGIVANPAVSRCSIKGLFLFLPSHTSFVTLARHACPFPGLSFLIWNEIGTQHPCSLGSVSSWPSWTGLGRPRWLPVGGDSTVPPRGHPDHQETGLGSGPGGRSVSDLCDLARLSRLITQRGRDLPKAQCQERRGSRVLDRGPRPAQT